MYKITVIGLIVTYIFWRLDCSSSTRFASIAARLNHVQRAFGLEATAATAVLIRIIQLFAKLFMRRFLRKIFGDRFVRKLDVAAFGLQSFAPIVMPTLVNLFSG